MWHTRTMASPSTLRRGTAKGNQDCVLLRQSLRKRRVRVSTPRSWSLGRGATGIGRLSLLNARRCACCACYARSTQSDQPNCQSERLANLHSYEHTLKSPHEWFTRKHPYDYTAHTNELSDAVVAKPAGAAQSARVHAVSSVQTLSTGLCSCVCRRRLSGARGGWLRQTGTQNHNR